jgi:hypothetical protein
LFKFPNMWSKITFFCLFCHTIQTSSNSLTCILTMSNKLLLIGILSNQDVLKSSTFFKLLYIYYISKKIGAVIVRP